MKTLPRYYPSNTDTVNAYQKEDILSLKQNFSRASALWAAEWAKQGSQDLGTCCGGKGIRVWYAAPRKRSAELTLVINSPPVQGNVSASRSVAPALEYLKELGIEASYYDGWMD